MAYMFIWSQARFRKLWLGCKSGVNHAMDCNRTALFSDHEWIQLVCRSPLILLVRHSVSTREVCGN